jgi:hypothetical protein
MIHQYIPTILSTVNELVPDFAFGVFATDAFGTDAFGTAFWRFFATKAVALQFAIVLTLSSFVEHYRLYCSSVSKKTGRHAVEKRQPRRQGAWVQCGLAGTGVDTSASRGHPNYLDTPWRGSCQGIV